MKTLLSVLLTLTFSTLSFAQRDAKDLPTPTYKGVECFSERYDHERPLKIEGKVQYDSNGKYVMEKYYTFNHRVRGTFFIELPMVNYKAERYFLSPVNPTKEGSKVFSSIFVENKKLDPVKNELVTSDTSNYDIRLGFQFFPDPDFLNKEKNEKYELSSYQAKLVLQPSLSSNIYQPTTFDLYCQIHKPIPQAP